MTHTNHRTDVYSGFSAKAKDVSEQDEARIAELRQAVEECFESQGVRWTYHESPNCYHFTINTRTTMGDITGLVVLHPTVINVHALCPIHVSQDAFPQVYEFIHRANYGLVRGNFEIDSDDGEFNFKAVLDCPDAVPSQESIVDAISLAAAMMELYGDALLSVAFGFSNAKDAIAKAEEKAAASED